MPACLQWGRLSELNSQFRRKALFLQRRFALVMVRLFESRWVASMEKWEDRHGWWSALLVGLVTSAVLLPIMRSFGVPWNAAVFLAPSTGLVLFVFYGLQVRSGQARESRRLGRALWRSLGQLPPRD